MGKEHLRAIVAFLTDDFDVVRTRGRVFICRGGRSVTARGPLTTQGMKRSKRRLAVNS